MPGAAGSCGPGLPCGSPCDNDKDCNVLSGCDQCQGGVCTFNPRGCGANCTNNNDCADQICSHCADGLCAPGARTCPRSRVRRWQTRSRLSCVFIISVRRLLRQRPRLQPVRQQLHLLLVERVPPGVRQPVLEQQPVRSQHVSHLRSLGRLHLPAQACQYVASHRIASHRIASHRIASHRIASHRIASHRTPSSDASELHPVVRRQRALVDADPEAPPQASCRAQEAQAAHCVKRRRAKRREFVPRRVGSATLPRCSIAFAFAFAHLFHSFPSFCFPQYCRFLIVRAPSVCMCAFVASPPALDNTCYTWRTPQLAKATAARLSCCLIRPLYCIVLYCVHETDAHYLTHSLSFSCPTYLPTWLSLSLVIQPYTHDNASGCSS